MVAQMVFRKSLAVMAAVMLLLQAATVAQVSAAPKDIGKVEKTAAKIDLNTATEKELQELPGIGEAWSKKIISGRPYKSVQDLAKLGIPTATIDKITKLVSVKAPPTKAEKATDKASKSAGKAEDKATQRTPPKKGMVWVNTESKVYHKEGTRWYGTTKEGKWMTEEEATKAGYRAAKE